MSSLEKYFEPFRSEIIGIDDHYETPYGIKKILYFDWIASGRLYRPIEKKLVEVFGPFVANTHTETSETGSRMTWSYQEAQRIIKEHVNAGPEDVLITAGTGMTTVVNKLIRMLGFRARCVEDLQEDKIEDRPVVFVTHMEHHSNHTSWYETLAEVVVLPPGDGLLVDPAILEREIEKYRDRKFKIGSFSACSNVTGIFTPYYKLAKIMHRNGGICFIDFAASAPYVPIDMHPGDPLEKLDAVFFSPHKFLGGPGSSGVLVFDSALYNNEVPDNPGGGTVDWTNAWGEYKFVDDIELREDGGTPGFLQAIRSALSIKLKMQMGPEKILAREAEMLKIIFKGLHDIPGMNIMADNVKQRLGVVSFFLDDIHFNLIVKLLSDRFGIQVRGGCVCAGTYGHYLLKVGYDKSQNITERINSGDLSDKPGWVRMSVHPTTTNDDLYYFIDAVRAVAENVGKWQNDYIYDKETNEYYHINDKGERKEAIGQWFEF